MEALDLYLHDLKKTVRIEELGFPATVFEIKYRLSQQMTSGSGYYIENQILTVGEKELDNANKVMDGEGVAIKLMEPKELNVPSNTGKVTSSKFITTADAYYYYKNNTYNNGHTHELLYLKKIVDAKFHQYYKDLIKFLIRGAGVKIKADTLFMGGWQETQDDVNKIFKRLVAIAKSTTSGGALSAVSLTPPEKASVMYALFDGGYDGNGVFGVPGSNKYKKNLLKLQKILGVFITSKGETATTTTTSKYVKGNMVKEIAIASPTEVYENFDFSDWACAKDQNTEKIIKHYVKKYGVPQTLNTRATGFLKWKGTSSMHQGVKCIALRSNPVQKQIEFCIVKKKGGKCIVRKV